MAAVVAATNKPAVLQMPMFSWASLLEKTNRISITVPPNFQMTLIPAGTANAFWDQCWSDP